MMLGLFGYLLKKGNVAAMMFYWKEFRNLLDQKKAQLELELKGKEIRTKRNWSSDVFLIILLSRRKYRMQKKVGREVKGIYYKSYGNKDH